jgi:ComF family protein
MSESPAFSLCGRCLNKPPPFERVLAPYRYDAALRHLIGALKFDGRFAHARLLGDLLAKFVQTHVDARPDLILPVPLHPARYCQRGFNQSIEIARHVAKTLDIPLELSGCRRQRDTPPQHQLSAKQRRKNVRSAFALTRPFTAQRIAILDDVMTTGSTVQTLAALLKQAGAATVEVWVCARA